MTLHVPAHYGLFDESSSQGIGSAAEADEAPAEPAMDFVSLDDAGQFAYHPDSHELLTHFEYPAEAITIVDREGVARGLALSADRTLILGKPQGRVDFPSLRQSWLRAQKLRPQSYPLHRLPPASTPSLLDCLFESLQLEARPARFALPWTVQVFGTPFAQNVVAQPLSLSEVDRYLAELDDLEHILVQDPFGHRYSPVRQQTHRFLAPAAGFIYYVEVPHRRG